MLNVLLWIDNSYGQCLIPKGSTVFMEIWAMHQDEKIFKNADKFDPDRYLKHPNLPMSMRHPWTMKIEISLVLTL